MNRKLKIFLVFAGICVLYTLFNYHPVIFASFDEDKYVDGEVFTPVNGVYDFRKFTLNSSQTRNYTTIIDTNGFAQFVDDKGNHTINALEWNKMTSGRRERINSSFMLEFKKPNHVVDNITIYEVDFLGDKFYSAYLKDEKSNTEYYIATPNENETVEMIKTFKIK